MKKYFIVTCFLLFFTSVISFAQVDSADLMRSQKQLEKQNKRIEKQQKKVQKSNRKLEKQQKRLSRQNRKLEKQNKRGNKEMNDIERQQKKLEDAKSDSTSNTLLYYNNEAVIPKEFNTKSFIAA